MSSKHACKHACARALRARQRREVFRDADGTSIFSETDSQHAQTADGTHTHLPLKALPSAARTVVHNDKWRRKRLGQRHPDDDDDDDDDVDDVDNVDVDVDVDVDDNKHEQRSRRSSAEHERSMADFLPTPPTPTRVSTTLSSDAAASSARVCGEQMSSLVDMLDAMVTRTDDDTRALLAAQRAALVDECSAAAALCADCADCADCGDGNNDGNSNDAAAAQLIVMLERADRLEAAWRRFEQRQQAQAQQHSQHADTDDDDDDDDEHTRAKSKLPPGARLLNVH